MAVFHSSQPGHLIGKKWRNRTLLNFLVSSAGGTVFIKSIDASTHCKNATYLCEQIEEVINEVGEENVVQVVTDNAPNYVAAGRLLMERHPSIVWTPLKFVKPLDNYDAR
ncbi:hypothetical protein SUGI_0498890 [Cryptomeria japonica]|nr:hypothetical protein SUGI_0498890 [Cryptomeria japonica]